MAEKWMRHSFKEVDQSRESIFSGLVLTYTAAHSSPPRSPIIFALPPSLRPIIVSVRPLENILEERRQSKKAEM